MHLVLNGTDNAGQLPTPLVELVLADGQTQSKRYALLQLLVVISEYSSAELIRDVIHQTEAFKHEWGAVLKWLEDNAVSLPGSQQGTAARGKEAADPASEREELILLKLRELLVQ